MRFFKILVLHCLFGCNVSPSPTDVSPTENSWMLHPLDKMPLDYFAPDRTIPSLNSDLIGVLCVGRACIRRRGANPINLVRGVDEAGRWSIRCRRPTEAAIAADGASFMPDAVQGRDTSVRGKISKGRLVQWAQHPRTFGQGHIGRGHINPASLNLLNLGTHEKNLTHLKLPFRQGDLQCLFIQGSELAFGLHPSESSV
jgi:hypothetical protein